MGYVIKTGGTPGGATAANQAQQITIESEIYQSIRQSGSGIPSAFKDLNTNSVFQTTLGTNAGKSIFNSQCENNQTAPFTVTTFTAGSFAATAALLQTYLNTNDVVIVNISFSQGLGTHDILLVCNVL